MFIRNRGASSAVEQQRELQEVSDRKSRQGSNTREREERAAREARRTREERAAVKIQAIWRGRRERAYCERRRCRSKPWGYFTHTLALTYVSSVRNSLTAVSTKRFVYQLLEEPNSSKSAFVLSIAIVSTIVVSIGLFMVETLPHVYSAAPNLWMTLEVFCTLVFSAEYVSRLAVCDEGGLSRLHFVITPLNLFDLMAVLPFYVDLVMTIAGIQHSLILRMACLVRLIRLVRIFKLGRYASGMRLMGEAIQHSSQAISVLVFLLCMGVVLFSSALFHVERLSCPLREKLTRTELLEYAQECAEDYNRGVSPKYGLCCTEDSAPNNFPSIIAASWWSMATMTTVGYGEVYPRTTLGKCVGFVAMLVGMVLIALPVAIVGQKFQDIYELHDLEEAKLRAGTRLSAEGKVWSLVPASDAVHRLRHLPINDPVLASSVAELAGRLEDVWEQREQLSRNRRVELDRQTHFFNKAGKLVDGMRASVSDLRSPRPSISSRSSPQHGSLPRR